MFVSKYACIIRQSTAAIEILKKRHVTNMKSLKNNPKQGTILPIDNSVLLFLAEWWSSCSVGTF